MAGGDGDVRQVDLTTLRAALDRDETLRLEDAQRLPQRRARDLVDLQQRGFVGQRVADRQLAADDLAAQVVGDQLGHLGHAHRGRRAAEMAKSMARPSVDHDTSCTPLHDHAIDRKSYLSRFLVASCSEGVLMSSTTIDAGARTGPLTGVRVLDLTRGMPGAIATMLLADYGAEVIVVEAPTGDSRCGAPAATASGTAASAASSSISHDADGQRRPAAWPPAPTSSSRTTAPARWPARASATTTSPPATTTSCTARSRRTARPGSRPRPARLRRRRRRPPRDHERVGRQPRRADLPRSPGDRLLDGPAGHRSAS